MVTMTQTEVLHCLRCEKSSEFIEGKTYYQNIPIKKVIFICNQCKDYIVQLWIDR